MCENNTKTKKKEKSGKQSEIQKCKKYKIEIKMKGGTTKKQPYQIHYLAAGIVFLKETLPS